MLSVLFEGLAQVFEEQPILELKHLEKMERELLEQQLKEEKR